MIRKKKKVKVGLPPGTVEYVGNKEPAKTDVNIIDYSEDIFTVQTNVGKELNYAQVPENQSRFLFVSGLEDLEVIQKIGNDFNLHSLVVEDIVSTNQRPKIEEYGDYLFLVLKLFTYQEENHNLEYGQVSLIVGMNYVILIQENMHPIIQQLIDRMNSIKSRIRTMRADYLAYSLIDTITDSYFVSLENIGNLLEEIEEEVLEHPKPDSLSKIYELKSEILNFKKYFWPLRDVINKLHRTETTFISPKLQIYIRDIYDHVFRISDTLENYRELIFGLVEMYQSYQSNRMNDIMKTLTIISTVFIPLSFLAGFYGMNFAYMPELQFKYSYFILIFVMLGIVGFMIYFFKKKKWI